MNETVSSILYGFGFVQYGQVHPLVQRVEDACLSDEEALDFANHMRDWEGIKNRDENYYASELFPFVKRLFGVHFESTYPDWTPPEVLIQTVGFAWAPIRLAAAVIAPKVELILLHSTETERIARALERTVREDAEQGERNPPAVRRAQIDASNPTDVYRFIHDVLSEVQQQRVAVDVTGGKKSVVMGGALAAALRDLPAREVPLYYVDYELFLTQGGIPVPGTEFLSRLPNPLAVFSEREFAATRNLFSGHHYAGALEVLADADPSQTRKVTGPRADVLEALKAVAGVYAPWEAGRVGDARTALDANDVPGDLRERHSPGLDALVEGAALATPDAFVNYPILMLRTALDHYAAGLRLQSTGSAGSALVRYYAALEQALATWAFASIHTESKEALWTEYQGQKWSLDGLIRAACRETVNKRTSRDWCWHPPSAEPKKAILLESKRARNAFAHRNTAEAEPAAQRAEPVIRSVLCDVWARVAIGKPDFDTALHQHTFATSEDVERLATEPAATP